jgi:hypothetical protein
MREVLVIPAGRMANRMIQRIGAEAVSKRQPGVKVHSPAFPEWSIPHTPGYELYRSMFQLQNKFASKSMYLLSENTQKQFIIPKSRVLVVGNLLDIELLKESLSFAKVFFSTDACCSCCTNLSFTNLQNYNLVHVRLGDVWESNSKTAISYFPLGIDFYRAIADYNPKPFAILAEALTVAEKEYLQDIAAVSKGSVILQQGCALRDFQLIRSAETVTLSTSTYSWLASWLSDSAENIYVPNAGLFNSEVRPDINLIEINTDNRYKIFPAFKLRGR